MHSATVGVIYGKVGSTAFDVAVSDPMLRRLDYVAVDLDGRRVLAQVDKVTRISNVSFEDALAGEAGDADDKLTAAVTVIGFLDENRRVQTPRVPFRAGTPVVRADDALVTSVLGLEGTGADGAYLGFVKGSKIPVRLSMNTLAQKHLSVLAKTGAGKSYTVGVILEEFLKADVPLVILDPHGEYGSLRHANIEKPEIATLRRFGIKPMQFAKKIREFALDTRINPDAERLVLEGMNLEGRDIVDLVGGKISGGQVGVLYQAVKEVKDHLPAYTLKDVMDAVARNKSSAKWNVLNALEALDATRVFDIRGTPVSELVQPGQCTIINLKGTAPDIQEILVTRVTNLLWEARKRSEVPPHILVCEEAHNFCPERGVGSAISGPVLRTVASEGRKFGMGLVIVSQRPAKIDKNVLSQCNTQVVLKITNPNDLKAIVQSVEGITNETADEVQRLNIGSALVAGGGLTQPLFADVRPRQTRHGGRSVEVVSQEESDEPLSFIPDEPEPEPMEDDPWPPTSKPQPPAPMAVLARRPPRPEAAPPAAPPTPAAPPPAVPERLEVPPAFAAPRPLAEDDAIITATRRPRKPQLTSPSWDAADTAGIHRVAARIGIINGSHGPEHTISTLSRLAKDNGRNVDQRLGLYAEIARTLCTDDPHCLGCPVADQCQHHAQAQQERRRSRSGIRRLWNR